MRPRTASHPSHRVPSRATALLAGVHVPVLLACLTLASAPAAETQPARAAGVQLHEGTPVASGPDYRAEFGARGPRFVPALGARAAATRSLGLQLLEVVRGERRCFVPPDERAIRTAGERVEYVAQGVVERYDVVADGIEQSFLFAARPQGQGDLVVRLQLRTDLALVSADERNGLLFAAEGEGGVRIGGVTGVDANGERARGWIRSEGDLLELGLPATFVDSAAYPLLLDPLIGTEITIAGDITDVSACDVAWLDANRTYLAVWEKRFSANDADVVAQRLDEFGGLIGGPILLATGGENTNPAVGVLGVSERFVIAWENDTLGGNGLDVEACFVDTSGVASKEIVLGASVADDRTPDVGVNAFFGQVVWQEAGAGIVGANILPDAAGDPVQTHTLVISTDPTDSQPAITSAYGSDYEPLCVWHRNEGLTESIVGLRWLGAVPTLFDHEFDVFNGSALQELADPDVSAAGPDDYFVVWAVEGDGFDVEGRRIRFPDGSTPAGQATVSIAADGQDELEPAIAYAENQYVVLYLHGPLGLRRTRAVAIDAMTGAPLELMLDLASGLTPNAPAVAGGAAPGMEPLDDVLAVMTEEQTAFPFDTDLVGMRIEGIGGTVEDEPGSGCGGGGVTRVSAATEGNTGFRHELWGAEPFRPVLAAISKGSLSLPVGSGTLLVDPLELVGTYLLTTSALGYAGFTIEVPMTAVGMTFAEQWFVLPSGAACTPWGVDFSDGLVFTVE